MKRVALICRQRRQIIRRRHVSVSLGSEPRAKHAVCRTIKPPEEPGKFIVKLSEASIPIRYPENLAKIQQLYNEVEVKGILAKGKELIIWIKKQL